MTPDANELTQLRASLDATRISLDTVVKGIDKRTRRRTNWLLVALVVLAGYVSANAWARHVNDVETCRRGNETRELIRGITKEASLAAGEALIDASGADDPRAIERYRLVLDERLTEVVSRLGSRDC